MMIAALPFLAFLRLSTGWFAQLLDPGNFVELQLIRGGHEAADFTRMHVVQAVQEDGSQNFREL